MPGLKVPKLLPLLLRSCRDFAQFCLEFREDTGTFTAPGRYVSA
jgi:hypothetical protein